MQILLYSFHVPFFKFLHARSRVFKIFYRHIKDTLSTRITIYIKICMDFSRNILQTNDSDALYITKYWIDWTKLWHTFPSVPLTFELIFLTRPCSLINRFNSLIFERMKNISNLQSFYHSRSILNLSVQFLLRQNTHWTEMILLHPFEVAQLSIDVCTRV